MRCVPLELGFYLALCGENISEFEFTHVYFVRVYIIFYCDVQSQLF